MDKKMSLKEERVRKITKIYYSNPQIQKAIYEFSKNREISPRFFEGFGKRPDSFQYQGDIFQMVQKGATSFHCSEELWEDPLQIVTGMSEKQANELRIGWDLLIDIDCRWLDYSKKAAQAVIDSLTQHGIENLGVKFSGSKGFHIIVPWNAFPKEIAGTETKDLFPELPRKLISYLRYSSEKILKENLHEDFYKQFKNADIKKGIKCRSCSEIAEEHILTTLFCSHCRRREQRKSQKPLEKKFKCPDCSKELEVLDSRKIYTCKQCGINSNTNPHNFTQTIEVDLFELIGLDMILVSPRHLFRMPYSLHEKTALSSVVLNPQEVLNFEITDANPLKAKTQNFYPESKPDEAKEFVIRALDWYKQQETDPEETFLVDSKKKGDFKPMKLEGLTDEKFPPSVQKILQGVRDGRKRALFVLINFFRALNLESKDIEKRIKDWNEKNEVPLKEGYIKSQIMWAYRNKIILPPNFDKDYYKGIGIIPTDEEIRMKNPVSYTISKTLKNKKPAPKKSKSPITNFKNKE